MSALQRSKMAWRMKVKHLRNTGVFTDEMLEMWPDEASFIQWGKENGLHE